MIRGMIMISFEAEDVATARKIASHKGEQFAETTVLEFPKGTHFTFDVYEDITPSGIESAGVCAGKAMRRALFPQTEAGA